VQPRIRAGQDVWNVLGAGQHAAPDNGDVQRIFRSIHVHIGLTSDVRRDEITSGGKKKMESCD
jgi:hypothetical protein